MDTLPKLSDDSARGERDEISRTSALVRLTSHKVQEPEPKFGSRRSCYHRGEDMMDGLMQQKADAG